MNTISQDGKWEGIVENGCIVGYRPLVAVTTTDRPPDKPPETEGVKYDSEALARANADRPPPLDPAPCVCGYPFNPDCERCVLVRDLAAARDRADAGDRFKAFVHSYLDLHDVPHGDPDNEHQKQGCRIGARLDLLFAQRDAARDLAAELAKALDNTLTAWKRDADQGDGIIEEDAHVYDASRALLTRYRAAGQGTEGGASDD